MPAMKGYMRGMYEYKLNSLSRDSFKRTNASSRGFIISSYWAAFELFQIVFYPQEFYQQFWQKNNLEVRYLSYTGSQLNGGNLPEMLKEERFFNDVFYK